MTVAYLGLGSNMGDKEQNIRDALNKLSANPRIKLLKLASLYETSPWGNTDQDWFLNTVVEIDTDLSPQELLKVMSQVEEELGRVREQRWGPRTLDLDILLYGEDKVNEPDLQIPHPRLTQRAFVLVPLAELNPNMTLPDGQSLKALVKKVFRPQELSKAKSLIL